MAEKSSGSSDVTDFLQIPNKSDPDSIPQSLSVCSILMEVSAPEQMEQVYIIMHDFFKHSLLIVNTNATVNETTFVVSNEGEMYSITLNN